ncbi:MAG TPA: glycosyltransferase, partial [bacterium]
AVNIAFVTSSKIWSGVKTWMLEFGAELRHRGHAVHVFASDERFLSACWDHDLDVHPMRFGSDYNPASIMRFSRALRALHIDVACMNLNKDLRTAGIAARGLGIPVVHRVGLVGDLTAKWDARLAQRYLVDGILVTSQWLKTALLARYPFLSKDRIRAVYNGKRVEPVVPAERPRRRVRFVAASRLAPDKNHLDLLQACATLRAEGHETFACDIFGDGPMEPMLRQAIERMDLGGTVTLRGFAGKVAHRLQAYDFGILPSQREALSNTLLEFQAAGLPVVASHVGAAGEVVTQGENGYLYEAGDIAALTAHMRTCLLMDAATYQAMAEVARSTIRQRFHFHKVAGELEAYFRDLATLADRRGHAQTPQPA